MSVQIDDTQRVNSATKLHAHRQNMGSGHVDQGRYKSFPVQDDDHFDTVCRYVERHAVRATLVPRAEPWRWGSLSHWNRARSEGEVVVSGLAGSPSTRLVGARQRSMERSGIGGLASLCHTRLPVG